MSTAAIFHQPSFLTHITGIIYDLLRIFHKFLTKKWEMYGKIFLYCAKFMKFMKLRAQNGQASEEWCMSTLQETRGSEQLHTQALFAAEDLQHIFFALDTLRTYWGIINFIKMLWVLRKFDSCWKQKLLQQSSRFIFIWLTFPTGFYSAAFCKRFYLLFFFVAIICHFLQFGGRKMAESVKKNYFINIFAGQHIFIYCNSLLAETFLIENVCLALVKLARLQVSCFAEKQNFANKMFSHRISPNIWELFLFNYLAESSFNVPLSFKCIHAINAAKNNNKKLLKTLTTLVMPPKTRNTRPNDRRSAFQKTVCG